jgi:hypothetical protein
MSGVAEQEDAAHTETFRDPVMHAIGREPVHRLDLDLEVANRLVAHILEAKRVRAGRPLAPHRADETGPTFVLERKYRQEVGLIQIDMDFSVDRRSRGLDVRDIKDMLIILLCHDDPR